MSSRTLSQGESGYESGKISTLHNHSSFRQSGLGNPPFAHSPMQMALRQPTICTSLLVESL